jgi:HEAT repeat protein/cyclophilin family peptidyl-prolyl cis-trans isomerase
VTRIPIAAVLTATLLSAACASAPPPAVAPPPTLEKKIAWILQMEDQRVLHVPAPPQPAPPPGARGAAIAPVAPAPDLLRLLTDAEGRIRRRAALAVGRVGLPAGIAPLAQLLSDPEPEVRQMAAFSIGLIGDPAGAKALTGALADTSPLVQGRAAEALAAVGARDQAGAVAAMAAKYVATGILKPIAPDDLTYPMSPEIEAVRLAVYALARMKAYDALASLVLDQTGQPVSSWWPIAYALRRVDDPRAGPALLTLLKGGGVYTRAFAARGLGAVKSEVGHDVLVQIAGDAARDPAVGIEAIRAVGELKLHAAMPALERLVQSNAPDAVRAEAVAAIGAAGAPADADALLDLLSSRQAWLRAAAFRTVGALDADRFLIVLSGLDPDPEWSVRAAVAGALGALPEGRGFAQLSGRLNDPDHRALAAVLTALGATHKPEAIPLVAAKLVGADPFVRAAAAAALGELKATSAIPALRTAYEASRGDETYVARASILQAIAAIDPASAGPLAVQALQDRDWAVRVKAAALLNTLEPTRAVADAIRPAPSSLNPDVYMDPAIVSPAYSTQLYLETDKGTVQIELAMHDAPLTIHTFVALARRGFFDGLAIHRVVPGFVMQDGDPRGDGEGGPGYTIRDEINQRPFLRGTVGMALDWKDTGGSQYFITITPQPHLDGRYTVFGQVVNGMEVVDRLVVGDVVRRMRAWDGKN